MKEKSFWFGITLIIIFMLFKGKYINVILALLWLTPPIFFKEDQKVKGYFLGTGIFMIIQVLGKFFGA